MLDAVVLLEVVGITPDVEPLSVVPVPDPTVTSGEDEPVPDAVPVDTTEVPADVGLADPAAVHPATSANAPRTIATGRIRRANIIERTPLTDRLEQASLRRRRQSPALARIPAGLVGPV